jgi:uncharacterized protein YoxC
MTIEIGIAIIGFAFLIIAVALIFLIVSIRKTLRQVDLTLINLRVILDEQEPQIKSIVEQASLVSIDLRDKLESLNPLFNTASNFGEILEDFSDNLKNTTKQSYSEKESEDYSYLVDNRENRLQLIEMIKEFLNLASTSMSFWQKYKKRR